MMGLSMALQFDTMTVVLAAVAVTIIVGRVIMKLVKNPPPGPSGMPLLGSLLSFGKSAC